MPKMKSKKAATKRLKLTASGHIKRMQVGRRHNAHSKVTKQKRQLRKSGYVDSTDISRIRDLFQ
jgi:large subunit ribosomal protein L35